MRNPVSLVLTIATVIVATLSSGFLGWLVKFHFLVLFVTALLVPFMG